MFEAVKLPAGVSDLDPSLTNMNTNDLPHLRFAEETLILTIVFFFFGRGGREMEGEMRSSFSFLFFHYYYWVETIYDNWLGSAKICDSLRLDKIHEIRSGSLDLARFVIFIPLRFSLFTGFRTSDQCGKIVLTETNRCFRFRNLNMVFWFNSWSIYYLGYLCKCQTGNYDPVRL